MPILNWIGKDKIINHHLEVPFRVLDLAYGFSPQNLQSQTATNSGNKIIHGDNLLALKSLLPKYEGKIKCIYIDPPYNTGNEGWVYNDNVNDPQIKKWLGQVVGKEAEDLSRHDKWLCMMYPRLKLLHKLLADDGAIFISIDDNELANLRLMMDEIFGQQNFRNYIIIKRGTKSVQAQFENIDKLGIACEYLVCYTKSSSYRLPHFYFDLIEAKSGNWNNHWRGTDRPTMRYDLFGIIPQKGQWRWSKERSERAIKNYENYLSDLLDLGIEPTQQSLDKWYEENATNKNLEIDLLRLSKAGKPEHYIACTDKKFGNNLWTDLLVNGTSEFKKFSDESFDNPKNPKIIERIVKWFCDKNSIILDSFAGSGTTAQAVLNLNQEDGGNRKFILIEMQDYAKNITAARVERVICGYGEGQKAVAGLGGEFDFFELGAPLFIGENNEFLNEEINLETIRQYVWYSETKSSYQPNFVPKPIEDSDFSKKTKSIENAAIQLSRSNSELIQIQQKSNLIEFDSKKSPYFLGKKDQTAYYFIYEKDALTTLNYEVLAQIKTTAEQFLIYADNCLLGKDFMAQNNIIFKKIPRDITRF